VGRVQDAGEEQHRRLRRDHPRGPPVDRLVEQRAHLGEAVARDDAEDAQVGVEDDGGRFTRRHAVGGGDRAVRVGPDGDAEARRRVLRQDAAQGDVRTPGEPVGEVDHPRVAAVTGEDDCRGAATRVGVEPGGHAGRPVEDEVGGPLPDTERPARAR
jgi:hypothetical protein